MNNSTSPMAGFNAKEVIASLNPLAMYLENPDVTDIFANADGSVFIEDFKKGPFEAELILSEYERYNIIKAIATATRHITNANDPIMSATIPIYDCRIETYQPPCTDSPGFSIRKPGPMQPISKYVKEGRMTQDHADIIDKAVVEHKNIGIVGGTGTGKTTLINAIVDRISVLTPYDRLYIQEDTREIICPMKNKISALFPAHLAIDGLRMALRSKPKRLIFGELRHGEVTATFLDGANTGHSGCLFTLHANNSLLGLSRLYTLLCEGIPNGMPSKSRISEVINMILHLGSVSGFGPKLESILILKPDLTDNNGWNYELV